MKLIDSTLSNQIIKHVQNKLANIFFFNHIAVVEINEGIHLNKNNSSKVLDELKAYFGTKKPFGVVANRVHSYSIELLDTPFYRKELKNMKAYGVVGHDAASKMNATLENNFCTLDKIDFETIYDAVTYIYEKVKENKYLFVN
ncbi:hypothetical protein MHTCC0001_16780 [Flavobacteriaceae bacterium MHTCC 0001]